MSASEPEHNTFEKWNPDHFGRDAHYQRTIRTVSSNMISGDVLDIGCGSRVFYSLKNANSWTGLDISKRMLSGIEFYEKVDNIKILQGDILDAPMKDNAYDTVIVFFLLHHLARNNQKESAQRVQKTFHEIFRLLRPGGQLIIAENCRGPIEAPYHLLFSAIYPLVLKLAKIEMPYFWKPKHYKKFAKAAGFEDMPVYVHIPVIEKVFQPIIGAETPAFLNSDLIQKMTLFNFIKPKT